MDQRKMSRGRGGGGAAPPPPDPIDDSWATVSTSDDGRYTTDTLNFANNASTAQIGSAGGDTWQYYVRFQAVDIPAGSTINTARIELIAGNTEAAVSGNLVARVYASDEDDAAAVTSAADAMGRTRTTAYADWTLDGWNDNDVLSVTGLASVLQEVIDRPGWASGNDVLFLFDDNGSIRDVWVSQHESADANPTLIVNYTPPA